MRFSQALYSGVYSDLDGVSSLMTEPIDRSGDRIGRRSVPWRAGSRKRREKSRSRIAATESMSVSKSATKADPTMKASVMALEISDLPPPDTVAGLWQDVAFGAVPTSVQVLGSCGCWATVTR